MQVACNTNRRCCYQLLSNKFGLCPAWFHTYEMFPAGPALRCCHGDSGCDQQDLVGQSFDVSRDDWHNLESDLYLELLSSCCPRIPCQLSSPTNRSGSFDKMRGGCIVMYVLDQGAYSGKVGMFIGADIPRIFRMIPMRFQPLTLSLENQGHHSLNRAFALGSCIP